MSSSKHIQTCLRGMPNKFQCALLSINYIWSIPISCEKCRPTQGGAAIY